MATIDRLLRLPDNNTFFLFGPRQTGKSTLLQQTYGDKRCLRYDLLNTETYTRLLSRPELLRMEVETAMARGEGRRVLIDEIQRVPALLDEVHSLVETYKDLRFALSGSSARKLKRTHANMLGGRAWTLRLYPLTAHEIGPSFALADTLRFGALPSVVLSPDDTARSELLRSYVDTYIREEIEMEAQLRNLGAFLRFLPLVASENGAQVNFLNLARELSLSRDSVRSYYQILEDTLLGFFLLPFAKSVRKKIARHPKFYFFDCGVVRALQKKLSVPLIEESEEYGRAFEHFMIAEIIRLNDYLRLDLDISFYRTGSGSEVDCILTLPSGDFWAIEIKATKSPSSSQCAGLRSFRESFPKATCLLACRTPQPLQLGPFTAHPWQEVLQMIYDLGRPRN
jgi:predicted AAA+ superfamily ATPase